MASRDDLADLSPRARSLCVWLAQQGWDFRRAAAERGIEPAALYREWLEALDWNQSLAARIYRRPGTNEPVSRQAIEAQMKRLGIVRPPNLERELEGQGLQGGLDALREVHGFIARKSSTERLCCEQLLALARSYQELRDHDAARRTLVEVVQLARRINAPEIVARAVHPHTHSTFQGTRFGSYNRDTVDELESWIPALREAGELSALAIALAHLGYELYVSPTESGRRRGVDASDEGLEIAEKTGDALTLVTVKSFRTLQISGPDLLDERIELMKETREQAGELDTDMCYSALHASLTDLVEAGRFDEAEEVCEQLRSLEEACTAPWPERYRATLATLRGHWEEAQRLCRLQPGVPLDSAAQVLALLQFEAMKQRGDWENLESLVRWNANREPGLIGYRIALARVLSLMGRGDEVVDDMAKWSEDGFACVPRDFTWMPNMGLLADVAYEIDDRDHAEALYAALAPYSERMFVIRVMSTVRGPVAHSLARLATTLERFDTARAHFERALALAQLARARPYQAWIEYDYACALERENAADARPKIVELARQAAARARDTDMGWLARRADEISISNER